MTLRYLIELKEDLNIQQLRGKHNRKDLGHPGTKPSFSKADLVTDSVCTRWTKCGSEASSPIWLKLQVLADTGLPGPQACGFPSSSVSSPEIKIVFLFLPLSRNQFLEVLSVVLFLWIIRPLLHRINKLLFLPEANTLKAPFSDNTPIFPANTWWVSEKTVRAGRHSCARSPKSFMFSCQLCFVISNYWGGNVFFSAFLGSWWV